MNLSSICSSTFAVFRETNSCRKMKSSTLLNTINRCRGGLPHISCKHDQIKMRDYLERPVPHLPGVRHLYVNRPLGNPEYEYRCDAASTDVCSGQEPLIVCMFMSCLCLSQIHSRSSCSDARSCGKPDPVEDLMFLHESNMLAEVPPF